jgi:RNA recognition motif-containing protein
MATKLFVGSLPFSISYWDLEQLFAEIGTVVSAKVIVDRDSNRSKGFGFVEMEDDSQAKAAIEQLDGKEIEGRRIVVNEARPQENRERRDGGGFGGGRSGGGDFRDRRF